MPVEIVPVKIVVDHLVKKVTARLNYPVKISVQNSIRLVEHSGKINQSESLISLNREKPSTLDSTQKLFRFNLVFAMSRKIEK